MFYFVFHKVDPLASLAGEPRSRGSIRPGVAQKGRQASRSIVGSMIQRSAIGKDITKDHMAVPIAPKPRTSNIEKFAMETFKREKAKQKYQRMSTAGAALQAQQMTPLDREEDVTRECTFLTP